jgi:hypothetical protein
MNSRMFVINDVSLSGNMYALGKTILQGDVSMNSHLLVSDDVTMNSRMFVINDVSLSGNMYALGKTILQGDVSMNSSLFVAKDSTMNSRMFVTNDVSLSGDMYANGKTNLQGDVSMNSRLFISSDASFNGKIYASGNVGINQPNPTYSLDIDGNARLTNGLSITGTNGLSVTSSGTSTINAITALTSASGNVGINKSNPTYSLDIDGNARLTNGLSVTGTNGLSVTSSGTSTINSITALTSTSGNVGINQTSPVYPLDVSGAVRSTGPIIFGTPVTKYYNWTGISTTTTPTITLNFGNNSYYAKIHCFAYDSSANNISSQIMEVQGGNGNGISIPTISLITLVTASLNAITWNSPTFTSNEIALQTSQSLVTPASYIIRIEMVQSNNSPANVPVLSTIVFNGSGSNITTTYTY